MVANAIFTFRQSTMNRSNTLKVGKYSNLEIFINFFSGAVGVGIGIVIANFLGWI
jgi:hypothetical protein